MPEIPEQFQCKRGINDIQTYSGKKWASQSMNSLSVKGGVGEEIAGERVNGFRYKIKKEEGHGSEVRNRRIVGNHRWREKN